MIYCNFCCFLGGVSGYVMETPSLLSEMRGIATSPWECSELVVDMLYYYANQEDVQMSVTCVIVLGDRLKVGLIIILILISTWLVMNYLI